MKSCVRRKCVKNVGDAHRAVIFLVGFAFAVISGNVKRQRPGVGAIVEHGSKRDDTAHIVVFCDAQRLPAVFLPTIIWLGGARKCSEGETAMS